MYSRLWAAGAAALALVFAGTLGVSGGSGAKVPHVGPAVVEASTVIQTGLATWYGPDYDGNITACGQVYSSAEYTAASNTLPCGSVVTVANLASGHSVTVEITDRGAFRYPIVVDLSLAAFRAIADPDDGAVQVAI